MRDPTHALSSAPLDDVLALLLKQFKRLLAAKGVSLTDADIETIVGQVAARNPQDGRIPAIRAALVALVEESEAVLARWNLTFPQALDTNMDAIPGWESTAEFLDIANEKSNAEIRIAAGAALLAAFGDLRYRPYLTHLAAGDYDVDAIFARRVLAFKDEGETDG